MAGGKGKAGKDSGKAKSKVRYPPHPDIPPCSISKSSNW